MNTSPIRQPAFCLLCIVALSSAVAARQQNPVTSMVVEKIETRYVADRTSCQALIGSERQNCRVAAELRYDVALAELKRLRNEPATVVPDHGPQTEPAANIALASRGPSS